MKRVWIIRHAQSTSNASGVAEIPNLVGLSDLGLAQRDGLARELVQRIAFSEEKLGRIIVSRFKRTHESAEPLIRAFPNVPVILKDHHELTYLSPTLCRGSTRAMREEWVSNFWLRADPNYVQGDQAESFNAFMHRASKIYDEMANADEPGIDAWFGHGQFWVAFLLNGIVPFDATSQWMAFFRKVETTSPMKNTEKLEITFASAAQLIDRQRFVDYCSDDISIRRKFFSMFQRSIPEALSQIGHAYKNGDPLALTEVLHRLKAGITIFAAPSFVSLLNQVHTIAKGARSLDALYRPAALASSFSLCHNLRQLSDPKIDGC